MLSSRTLIHLSVRGTYEPVVCHPDHPVLSKLSDGEPPAYRQAKFVTSSMRLGIPVDDRAIVPQFKSDKFCLEHAWVCGYFVGDGWCVDSRHRTYFAVGDHDVPAVPNKLASVVKIGAAEKCKGARCSRYVTSDLEWWSLLKQFGKYSHGKKLPEWVHAMPVEHLESFVNGWLTADGCVDGRTGRRTISTVSKDLAFGLRKILAKLGICCSVSRYVPPTPTTTIKGRIVNRRTRYVVGWSIGSRKAPEDGHLWVPVRETTRVTYDRPECT